MLLIDYINHHYGDERGNRAAFLRDNKHILPQELSRWLKAGLKVHPDTGDIYKPTSKSIYIDAVIIEEKNALSPDILATLRMRAKAVQMSDNDYLQSLLDDEEARDYFTNYRSIVSARSDTPVHKIATIVNEHLSVLSERSEQYHYQSVLQSLVDELLDKKLIHLVVPMNLMAESDRLDIPRVAYYWYGGTVAKHVSNLLDTMELYLWHEHMSPYSEVIFIGAPNNVLASYLICERICKLLKKRKSSYKKEQGGWGSKKEIEDDANQYMLKFARGLFNRNQYIGDEPSQLRFIQYADEHYSYSMRW